ncbi:hypothetical protein AKJ16_DCAP01920 [Drosera capensis]
MAMNAADPVSNDHFHGVTHQDVPPHHELLPSMHGGDDPVFSAVPHRSSPDQEKESRDGFRLAFFQVLFNRSKNGFLFSLFSFEPWGSGLGTTKTLSGKSLEKHLLLRAK